MKSMSLSSLPHLQILEDVIAEQLPAAEARRNWWLLQIDRSIE